MKTFFKTTIILLAISLFISCSSDDNSGGTIMEQPVLTDFTYPHYINQTPKAEIISMYGNDYTEEENSSSEIKMSYNIADKGVKNIDFTLGSNLLYKVETIIYPSEENFNIIHSKIESEFTFHNTGSGNGLLYISYVNPDGYIFAIQYNEAYTILKLMIYLT